MVTIIPYIIEQNEKREKAMSTLVPVNPQNLLDLTTQLKDQILMYRQYNDEAYLDDVKREHIDRMHNSLYVLFVRIFNPSYKTDIPTEEQYVEMAKKKARTNNRWSLLYSDYPNKQFGSLLRTCKELQQASNACIDMNQRKDILVRAGDFSEITREVVDFAKWIDNAKKRSELAKIKKQISLDQE